MRSSNSDVATRLDTELISYLRVYFANSTHTICVSPCIFSAIMQGRGIFLEEWKIFPYNHIVPGVDIGYFYVTTVTSSTAQTKTRLV